MSEFAVTTVADKIFSDICSLITVSCNIRYTSPFPRSPTEYSRNTLSSLARPAEASAPNPRDTDSLELARYVSGNPEFAADGKPSKSSCKSCNEQNG